MKSTPEAGPKVGPIDASPKRRPARRRRPQRRSLFSDVFHLFFFGIGLAFVGIALHKAADAWHLVRRGSPTTGTVTGFEVRTDSKSRTTHFAQVSYRDRSGEPHVMLMSWASKPSARSVGQQFPVLHDPDQPSEARVDSFGELWGGALFAFGFGAVWSVLTALQWKKTLPVRRRRSR